MAKTVKEVQKNDSAIWRMFVFTGKDSTVEIGEKCRLSNVTITLMGNGATCIIGNNVTFNATFAKKIAINVADNSTVYIGDDFLFSKDIEIYTTDFHSIYDESYNCINQNADVRIGKHVWGEMHTLFLKGNVIADNCIIGAGSLTSEKCDNANAILTGRLAKIVRENITWEK